MVAPEDILKLVVVLLMSAVYVRYRYGPIWPRIRDKIGPRWPLILKIGSVATLVLWILLWVLADPEQRGGLHDIFGENAPWKR